MTARGARTWRSRILATVGVFAVAAGHAAWAAPHATTRTSPGPHYAGVPIQVEVAVSGFEESPAPEVSVDAPNGVGLEKVSVSPQISSSVRIVNGRVSRWRDVRHVVRYRLVVERAGTVTVGPFRLTQGRLTATAPAVTLSLGSVPASAAQALYLRLPQRPLWVGERVPVRLEWWVSEALAERVAGRRATVPLFDRLELFRFDDARDRDARGALIIESSAGAREFPATVRSERKDGEDFLVLTVTRTMTPLRAGTVALDAARIVVDEALRWNRNLFNERVPMNIRRVQAQSGAHTVVVREPPANGRPLSFAGIIGSGFSLSVDADRSVVNAGDPIALTLTVRGDGPLATLALPAFDGLGLDPADFGVPGGPVSGALTGDGGKRFRFHVRPRHDAVSAIPALEIGWFDAAKARYATARSQPIALSVRPAQVVGTGDVVVAPTPPRASGDARANADTGLADRAGAVAETGRSVTFSNLAIETNRARLTAPRDPWFARPATQAVVYGTALTMLCMAVWWRRRQSVDPGTRALRRALRRERGKIRGASEPGQIARALRAIVAAGGIGDARERLDRVLAECDALSFGRRQPEPGHIEQLRGDATSLADAVIENAR